MHTDQSTGETRHDIKKGAGQAGNPGMAAGNRIPTLLMPGQAPPTLTFDGRRQEGVQIELCPLAKGGFGSSPVFLVYCCPSN